MSRQSRLLPDRCAYLSEDTIAAIASAVGGAISVIRLSGPNAFLILGKLSPIARCDTFPPRVLRLVELISQDGILIDKALVAFFPGPHSFTGEDVVEFHLHGGAVTAGRLMETLLDLRARQALPGEFSFRAVRNGKMSFSQAQAVVDLISSSNEEAATLALEKLSGTQNRFLESIATSLRKLAVMAEVGIDFSDQDIENSNLTHVKEQLGPLLTTLQNLLESFARGQKIQEGIRAVFVGLPNSGKSSFFNALLGEDRSIVSEIAGTTRDIVRERLVLRNDALAVTLRLEDTAGLRKADNAIEKEGIVRTKEAVRSADLVLLLVDPTADFSLTRKEWNDLGPPNDKTLGFITKCDLVEAPKLQTLRNECETLGVPTWLETSSVSGQGIIRATQLIVTFCHKFVLRENGEVVLTRLDQYRMVHEAVEHLTRAGGTNELDLFAADVRHALYVLGPLIGTTLPDDILGQIFSEFCIGK